MDLADLFPGFEAKTIDTDGAKIFARIGGPAGAPPLVCLHGFPETHVMWAKIAPRLAERFRVVLPDLRGYGWSSVPEAEADHAQMSKRAMARDVVALMEELGHARFAVVGHDRGARVGYRLVLDHPGRVTRLALLDIVPTSAMWARMDAGFAMKTYHWLFLAQPAPMPERLIGRGPVDWLEHTLASWTKAKDLSPFGKRALAHYRAFFSVPERIAATCEDYRAGASIDRALDEADLAGTRRIDVPTLVLWGAAGIPAGPSGSDPQAGPLAAWAPFMAPGASLDGAGLDCGHFLAEEAPEATAERLLAFL